jgi:drug/metabolite transporter (DMT)-like permease
VTDSAQARSGGSLRMGAGELWALGAALSYSLTNIYTSLAARGEGMNYFLGVAVRATPAFLLAVVLAAARSRRPDAAPPAGRKPDARLNLVLFASGLFTFVLGNPLMFAALRAGGVLVTSPITGTHVLWGALFAAFLLHEPLNRRMVWAMLLSVSGVVVLTLGRTAQAALAPRWWVAVPYAAATAISWAMGGVLTVYALRRGVDRFRALATTSGTALICLNAYLLLSGQISSYVTTSSAPMISSLVAGLFNAAALVCATSAFALTSVASASTLGSLQIAVSPLIAWLFLGEELNGAMALGILLITLGVIGVQRARL